MNEWDLGFQAAGLLGARAPSTAWVSLMFAAQFGSLQWAISWLLSLIWVLVTVFVILLVVLLVAYLVICKLQIQELFVPVVRALLLCGAQAGVVLATTAFALIIVVESPRSARNAKLPLAPSRFAERHNFCADMTRSRTAPTLNVFSEHVQGGLDGWCSLFGAQ